MVKVVLLDRDGVLNRDRSDYVKSPTELEVFPYAPAALERLRRAGFLLYIVSNQSAVGRGLMTDRDLEAVTAKLVAELGPFDGIFYCVHKPEDLCDCRKPAPGLLHRALADAAARGPVTETWLVGDSPGDVAAGATAGCRTVLVVSGSDYKFDPEGAEPRPDYIAADLDGAVTIILGRSRPIIK